VPHDGSTKDTDVHGVFIAIGHTPNTGIFEGSVDMNHGYIQIQSGTQGNATQTSVSRLLLYSIVILPVFDFSISWSDKIFSLENLSLR
jgi:thioredoxin reductase (NADPH)